jgi:uncharacterized protein (DUF2267 family)
LPRVSEGASINRGVGVPRCLEDDATIAAGLDVFARTLHKTYEWLANLMGLLGVDDRQVAYQAFRATLHALRDRLTLEEVAQLGAQLPMLVRGFYYEGWDPTAKPLKLRHMEAFLAYIASEFNHEDVDPEQAARALLPCWQSE